MAADELIIVFAKPATPGAVKTRLLTIVTPEQAARFHLAAPSDVVTAARRTSRPVELHLASALDLLAAVDLALGLAHDGGCNAFAARSSAWPAARTVFGGILWSTAEVLEATLLRARKAGLSYSLAPEWYDVDGPEDLHLLDRDAAEKSATLGFIREALGRV